MSPMLDRIMVTPVSSSQGAFGLVHTRRVTSTLTLPVQPRERAMPQDRVDISVAGRQQATASAEAPLEEQTAAQSGGDWLAAWGIIRTRDNSPARPRVSASTRPGGATARTGTSPGCRSVRQRRPELYVSDRP